MHRVRTTNRRRVGKEGPYPGANVHKNTNTMYAGGSIAHAPFKRFLVSLDFQASRSGVKKMAMTAFFGISVHICIAVFFIFCFCLHQVTSRTHNSLNQNN
jgi:hypothetical protein